MREQNLNDGLKEIERVLHRESFMNLFEILKTEIISRHHDDMLVGHFEIDKTGELIAWKYY